MSSNLQTRKRFGSFIGNSNDDLRVSIGGPLQKNALAIVASYNPTPIVNVVPPPPMLIPAYNATRFWGRLLVFEGIPDSVGLSAAPLDLITQLTDQVTVLFDHALPTVGPWFFLFPISQLEANLQTSQGGILTIILGRGFTDAGGDVFIPRLTVSGQTVQQGGFV